MELRLERDGQRVTLHLKKNDNVRDDVPVFTSENKVVGKLDTSKMPVSIICYLSLNVMIFRFTTGKEIFKFDQNLVKSFVFKIKRFSSN